jgi:hypothetical protein
MISHHGLPAFAIYKAQFAFSHAQSKHLNKKKWSNLAVFTRDHAAGRSVRK